MQRDGQMHGLLWIPASVLQADPSLPHGDEGRPEAGVSVPGREEARFRSRICWSIMSQAKSWRRESIPSSPELPAGRQSPGPHEQILNLTCENTRNASTETCSKPAELLQTTLGNKVFGISVNIRQER